MVVFRLVCYLPYVVSLDSSLKNTIIHTDYLYCPRQLPIFLHPIFLKVPLPVLPFAVRFADILHSGSQ